MGYRMILRWPYIYHPILVRSTDESTQSYHPLFGLAPWPCLERRIASSLHHSSKYCTMQLDGRMAGQV